MSNAERRKGIDFERWVARRINKYLPHLEAKRGLQYQGGGAAVPDVIADKLWIECKRGKATQLKQAYRRVREQVPKGHVAMAVCKDDNDPPVVCIALEDLLKLVRGKREAPKDGGKA